MITPRRALDTLPSQQVIRIALDLRELKSKDAVVRGVEAVTIRDGEKVVLEVDSE
jgi:hypothetical protein